jgi:hypothetical protein
MARKHRPTSQIDAQPSSDQPEGAVKRAARRTVWTAVVASLVGIAIGGVLPRLVFTLALPDEGQVRLPQSIPIRMQMNQPLDARIPGPFEGQAQIHGPIQVNLRDTLRIPLHLDLDVPIDTEMSIDQEIEIDLQVPVRTVLTDRELALGTLEVPIDTEVWVDDVVHVEGVVAVDTHVRSVMGMQVPVVGDIPVSMRVPIRQRLRVRDRLQVTVNGLRAPLDLVIPVRTRVPIRETLRIQGSVHVPIRKTIPVRIQQVVTATIDPPFPISVSLDDTLPIDVSGEIDGEVRIANPMPARIGPIQVRTQDLKVQVR